MLRNRSPNRSHNSVYKKFSPKPSGKENSGPSITSNQKKVEKSDRNEFNNEAYLNMSIKCEPMELKPKVKNPLFKNKSARDIPIPRGNTPYCKAKRAEYVERDLAKAEKYYRQAIESNERLESAIKDLATVLHQQGKTEEACKFLEGHRKIYTGDLAKYDNLMLNLKKQIVPSGNCLNRTLVLFDISDAYDKDIIKRLFSNSSRILSIEFKRGQAEDHSIKDHKNKVLNERFCLIHFASYSAARKTLETLKDEKRYQFYWMNIYGKIAGKADLSKNLAEELQTKKSDLADSQSASLEDVGSVSKAESENDQISLTTPSESEQENEIEDPVESVELKSIEEESNSDSESDDHDSLKGDEVIIGSKDSLNDINSELEIKPPSRPVIKPAEEFNFTFNPNSECWNRAILARISDDVEEKGLPLQSLSFSKEDVVPREIANKSLESEDNWESFIWRRKLARAKEHQKLPRSTIPLSEKVKKCEAEYNSKIANDSNYLSNLLQSLIVEKKDEKISCNNNSDKDKPFYFNFNDGSLQYYSSPSPSDSYKNTSYQNNASANFFNQQKQSHWPQPVPKRSGNLSNHSQMFNVKSTSSQSSSGSPYFNFTNFQGQSAGQSQFTNYL